MGVRDNGGGAVGQHRLDKFRGADQRAFQMDMGVQKAGEDDFPGSVHLCFAVIAAHADNEPLCHGNVHGGNFVGKDVDKGGVFQHQLRRLPSGGSGNDSLLFQQPAVDFPGVAFRLETAPFRLYQLL